MNAFWKKVFSWLGVIVGGIIGIFIGKRCFADRKRVGDIKDVVDNSRKEVDGIGERNQQLAESLEQSKGTVDQLRDGADKIAENMRNASDTLGDAHRAIDDGLKVIADVEKRNNLDNN